MPNIPKSYKYRYNGVIHTGPSVPDGAELLETTDILSTETYNILSLIYPVGSIYIGIQEDCPLKTLISGSTWELVSAGRVLQGADSGHAAGTTIEAGLPNITGHMNNTLWCVDKNISGAFQETGYSDGFRGTSTGAGAWNVYFDASRSNSIYGNSTTVQPPAYVVNIWRRTA